MEAPYRLDIIIPVYNEGKNIVAVLDSLNKYVKTSFRILICYDSAEDTTLPVVKSYTSRSQMNFLRNEGRGVLGAVLTGFHHSDAEAVLVMPADDTYNAPMIDRMFVAYRQGSEIVVASRFIKGGCMKGCPLIKAFLVRMASFTLRYLAQLPVSDASNGFRLFSRRVIERIPVESEQGFVYSLEFLVKCHRLGWKISEVPALWFERSHGKSRFRTFRWLPFYLRWYLYAFETTYVRKTPAMVKLKG